MKLRKKAIWQVMSFLMVLLMAMEMMISGMDGKEVLAASSSKIGTPELTLKIGKNGFSIRVTTGTVKNADGCDIYLKMKGGSYSKIRNLVYSGKNTSFTHSLIESGTYYIKAKAYKMNGNKKEYGEACKPIKINIKQNDTEAIKNELIEFIQDYYNTTQIMSDCYTPGELNYRFITVDKRPGLQIGDSIFVYYKGKVQHLFTGYNNEHNITEIFSNGIYSMEYTSGGQNSIFYYKLSADGSIKDVGGVDRYLDGFSLRFQGKEYVWKVNFLDSDGVTWFTTDPMVYLENISSICKPEDYSYDANRYAVTSVAELKKLLLKWGKYIGKVLPKKETAYSNLNSAALELKISKTDISNKRLREFADNNLPVILKDLNEKQIEKQIYNYDYDSSNMSLNIYRYEYGSVTFNGKKGMFLSVNTSAQYGGQNYYWSILVNEKGVIKRKWSKVHYDSGAGYNVMIIDVDGLICESDGDEGWSKYTYYIPDGNKSLKTLGIEYDNYGYDGNDKYDYTASYYLPGKAFQTEELLYETKSKDGFKKAKDMTFTQYLKKENKIKDTSKEGFKRVKLTTVEMNLSTQDW